MTKSLFSRGSRILRRQGSKFNIAATLDEEDEVEREKSRFEVSEIFSRHHKTRQSNARKSKPPQGNIRQRGRDFKLTPSVTLVYRRTFEEPDFQSL